MLARHFRYDSGLFMLVWCLILLFVGFWFQAWTDRKLKKQKDSERPPRKRSKKRKKRRLLRLGEERRR